MSPNWTRDDGTSDFAVGGASAAAAPPAPAIAKHSAVTSEHYTPPWIIEGARAVMGGIDLDPASTSLVNTSHVKASRFFDEPSDGLAQPWTGRVFLNPPGGRIGGKSNAGIWWAKLIEAYEAREVAQAVFVAYSLELFQTAQRRGVAPPFVFPFCVPTTRVKYYVRDGSSFREGTSAPNASAIIYLPRRAATPPMYPGTDTIREGAVIDFARVFRQHGVVRT